MICYKDMTFCIAPCSNTECHRLFTKEVQKQADEWWGKASGDAPIAISDYSDNCPEFKPVKGNNDEEDST